MIETLGTLSAAAGHDLREVRFMDVPSEKYVQMGLAYAPSESGISVTENSALQYTAVFACVRIIAEDIATIPLDIMRYVDGGKNDASDHYLYNILKYAPNPEMTAVTFWETCMGHLLTWGNAYAEIEWDGAGRAKYLWPLDPAQMAVSRNAAGKVDYRYGGKPMDPTDVLHIPALGYDGICGYSPIRMAREAVGLGLAPEKFASKFYGNGAQLGTVFTSDLPYNQPNAEAAKKAIDSAHAGVGQAFKTMVLFGGLKPMPLGLPQKDAQYIESRRFQLEEICRIYRVPPHMVADLERATFSNIEQQDIGYAKHTLRPWCKRIEAVLKVKLFGVNNPAFAEFNLEGLLRGDIKSRYEAYSLAINAGFMTRDEARRRENLNPRGGNADELTSQMQNVPLDKLGQEPAVQPPSGGNQ